VLFVSGIIILCDQVSKLLVKGLHIPSLGISINGMQYGASKPILGQFFRLTYIENPGMAFGIDIGGKLFFSIFSILASIAIIVYLYRARNENLGFRFSLAMILGGAIGNLIDRVLYGVVFDDAPLFYGKVVDFFDLDFFNIDILGYHLSRWPVFNIADASVTIGVILLLFFHRSVISEQHVPVVPSAPTGVQPLPSGNAADRPTTAIDDRSASSQSDFH
jgi:signal peptidase II